MTTKLMIGLAGLLLSANIRAQQFFSVKDYGASGAKSQSATSLIQKTIDACAAKGGGTVYFPPGDYTTSTVKLASNITIHLEAGATWFASRNPAEYVTTKGIYSTETDVPVLIYGENLKKISFLGRGTVDGQADHTWEPLREIDNFIAEETEIARKAGIDMKRAYAKDPKVSLFYLTNCEDVLFADISVLHSPNWALHLAHSRRVSIRNLYIFSSLTLGVNSDGIDIDGCQDVKISDCTVITGDDAICLKSTSKNEVYQPCEFITVTNCTLVSTSTALKIGTESHGDFRHIVFSNSVIRDSNRGIGIFVRDGAHVSQVIFSNLTIECNRKHFNWWGDGDPIRFVLLKRRPDSRLGMIEDVLVENVLAKGQGSSLVAGHETKPIKNIRMHNIHIQMYAESLPDKRAVHGLIFQQVDGLELSQASLSWQAEKPEPLWANAVQMNDCLHVRVNEIALSLSNQQAYLSALHLQNCKTVHLGNLVLPKQEKRGIRLSGPNTESIYLNARLKPVLQLGTDIPKSSVVFN